jgi:hypothetical protein
MIQANGEPDVQTQLIAALQGKGVQPPAAVGAAPDLASFDRRGGSTGGVWKGAASGASTGASIGSMAGNPYTAAIGAGAGALTGMVKGAINKHATTAPTDFNVGDARTAIGQEYQHDLGRDASPQEIEQQLTGQGWQQGDRYVGEKGLTSVLGSIGSSDEAKQYASGGPKPAAAATDAPPASGSGGTRQYVEDYFKSRGVNPYDGSIEYWTDKIDKGGDPDYYKGRLQDADEFSNKGAHYDWVGHQGGNAPSAGGGDMLGGDATANIQAALGKLGTQPDMIKQLIAALSGGQ